MKKLIALILALAMCLSLVACGGKTEEAKPAETQAAAAAPEAEAAAPEAAGPVYETTTLLTSPSTKV